MSRRIFGEGDGTPLQYSCLENPMDGGDWWAAVHGVIKNQTRPSDRTITAANSVTANINDKTNINDHIVIAGASVSLILPH